MNPIYVVHDRCRNHPQVHRLSVEGADGETGTRIGGKKCCNSWERVHRFRVDPQELIDACHEYGDPATIEDPCPGEGKCHGCLSWCNHCGSVTQVCDDRRCDHHFPIGPEGLRPDAPNALLNYEG